MDLSDLIDVSAIMPALKANSKKQLLQLLAERAATISGIPEREVFDIILQRERLGSTGVGNGIAIPHGKLPGVKRIAGVFARLETPVDLNRSMTSLSTWCFFCWRLKVPGQIISRRCRASRGCCAMPTRWPRSAVRATPMPSWRCFRRHRLRTQPDISEN